MKKIIIILFVWLSLSTTIYAQGFNNECLAYFDQDKVTLTVNGENALLSSFTEKEIPFAISVNPSSKYNTPELRGKLARIIVDSSDGYGILLIPSNIHKYENRQNCSIEKIEQISYVIIQFDQLIEVDDFLLNSSETENEPIFKHNPSTRGKPKQKVTSKDPQTQKIDKGLPPKDTNKAFKAKTIDMTQLLSNVKNQGFDIAIDKSLSTFSLAACSCIQDTVLELINTNQNNARMFYLEDGGNALDLRLKDPLWTTKFCLEDFHGSSSSIESSVNRFINSNQKYLILVTDGENGSLDEIRELLQRKKHDQQIYIAVCTSHSQLTVYQLNDDYLKLMSTDRFDSHSKRRHHLYNLTNKRNLINID